MFEKSYQLLFQQLFAALFGSMFVAKYLWLWVQLCLAPCRRKQLGRRPVGRGVGGRIVVEERSTATYR
ncbi:hypothetical protein FJY68_04165 [candidate division WOR-3 bacterium]|uniref:Uncharacterized protein n=1 Tax=candidate division WOR-3 bacterium TaxID=2052148 RepID=A0A938BPC0_UNCW3|nr:hypothetical protein [candidate division WOR-3 bacterium]